MTYLLLLLATVVIEGGLAACLAPAGTRPRALWDSVFLNLFTHPLATLAIGALRQAFVTVEMVVAVVEAIGYRTVTRLGWARAIAISGVCNLATAFLAAL